MRHGERTPVSDRFEEHGLPRRKYTVLAFRDAETNLQSDWKYCQSAQQLSSIIKTADGGWSQIQWRRAIETIGKDNAPEMKGTDYWYETKLRA
jgi:hypothetical protein